MKSKKNNKNSDIRSLLGTIAKRYLVFYFLAQQPQHTKHEAMTILAKLAKLINMDKK